MDPVVASRYRLAPAYVARIVGSALVVVAVLAFVATLVSALARWPLGVLVGLVSAGVVLIVGVAVWIARRPVLVFDDEGYSVRLFRGTGVSAAPWSEVAEVSPATAAGAGRRQRCVVLTLAGGRATTIPLDPLAATPDVVVEDLRSRLRRGHGIRDLADQA